MKAQNNIENWDLIAKYYANECNQNEIDELFSWVEISNENKELFNQIKKDLEIINLSKSMNNVNVDSAWEKVKNRILEDNESLPKLEESNVRKISFTSVLKYAAMVIVLIGLGIITTKVVNISSNELNTVYADLNEQGKEIVLPDGTKVFLNSESTLSFPKEFKSNERRVELTGEAFFDVTKNPEKPFVIESNEAEVKVLGTSFNVNANLPNHEIEVYVKTGLVQLSRKESINEKILINPGDVGKLTSSSINKVKNDNPNILAWKTKKIIFNEDRLSNVISTLNKVYNVDIACNDTHVLDLKYSSTFRNQEIDSILTVICLTLDLKTIESDDNQIILVKHFN